VPKVIVQLPFLSRPRAASFRKTAKMADGWSNTGRGCCIAKRRIQGWNPKCPVRFLRAQSWLVVIGRHWSYSDIFGHSTWVVISQVLIMWHVCFPTFTSYVPQYLFGHFISQEFGLPMAGWLEATVGTLHREVPLLPTTSSEIMMFETFGKLPRLWDFLILGFPVW